MIVDFNTKFNFGKYKGKTPRQIIENGDLGYLYWIENNVGFVAFSKELEDEIASFSVTYYDFFSGQDNPFYEHF